MPCDARGRAYRKYYDDIFSLESNLQTVTDEGNVTTHGIRVFGSVDVDGFFFGDAGFVTDVPSNPGVPDLQTVTGYGPSTSDKVSFSGVYADGNVVINGNVTCSELIGNGEFLGGVANAYELSVLDSKITVTESNIIITNTSGLTDVTKGDLLVSTSDGVLDKLTIGSVDQVLLANTTTSLVEWINIDFSNTITDIPDRVNTLEQNIIFSNTNDITSFNTGDILYAEDTNQLINLERETRANNTFRTEFNYSTGWGRILRVDEKRENALWLHPTSDLEVIGERQIVVGYLYGFPTSAVIESFPFIITGSSPINYLHIDNKVISDTVQVYDRIYIANMYTSVKFGYGAFYSEDGIRYLDTPDYNGNSSTKHPDDIKFKLYVCSSNIDQGLHAKYFHGDGSKLVFSNALPSLPPPGGGVITVPRGGGDTGLPDSIGKGGFLTLHSDKRLKNKIREMTHALDKLSRLVPKLYDKDGKRESGFIAQEMYYDVREMRHIVWPDRDANPNEDVPEPDYSDWGKRPACLRYLHFIAYVVKSIQELKERIERLKNNKK